MTRVEGVLEYLSPMSVRNLTYMTPMGAERRFAEYEYHRVLIRNGRLASQGFSLDHHGFTLCRADLPVFDLDNVDTVIRTYLGAVENFIGNRLGASFVTTINYVARSTADDLKVTRSRSGPAMDVHVDFTPQSAVQAAEDVLRRHGKRSADFRCFSIMGVWRALSPPPQDLPLALCDGRTVQSDEGVPIFEIDVERLPDDADLPEPVDTTARPSWHAFQFRPKHQWYYFPDMHVDEVLFFKLFDSNCIGAWRVPHAAFADPTSLTASPRRSIEVRALACF